MCLSGHSLYHLLSPSRISKLRQRGHSFLLPDYITDLHKIVYCTITLQVCLTLITLYIVQYHCVIVTMTLLMCFMFYVIMCLFLY